MLNWEQVKEIRALSAAGVSRKAIASKFGLHVSMVANIVLRKSWNHPKPFKHWRDQKKRYELNQNTGCWEWLGALNADGYGVKRDQRCETAHRWMYKKHRGEIPEGCELDHLCRNRACVNPDHLEPVPHRENVLRGAVVKVDQSQWSTIRDLYKTTPLSQQAIADMFGVKQALISKIVLEKYGYQSKSSK